MKKYFFMTINRRVLQRSKKNTKSVIWWSAYLSGTKVYDNRIRKSYNHTKKKVAYTEILLPEGVPEEFKERSYLWDKVQASEKQWNAQEGVEIEIALPTIIKDIELYKDIARKVTKRAVVDRKGFAAQFSVHLENKANPHFHILHSLRPLSPNGLGKKDRDEFINRRSIIKELREIAAEEVNNALITIGKADKLEATEKSFKDLGIKRIPMLHLGPKTANAKKNGKSLILDKTNRLINNINSLNLIGEHFLKFDKMIRILKNKLRRNVATDLLEQEITKIGSALPVTNQSKSRLFSPFAQNISAHSQSENDGDNQVHNTHNRKEHENLVQNESTSLANLNQNHTGN